MIDAVIAIFVATLAASYAIRLDADAWVIRSLWFVTGVTLSYGTGRLLGIWI